MNQINEVLLLTVALSSLEDIVMVRQRSRHLMTLLGYAAFEQTQLITAVSEIARNACQYAGGGMVRYSVNLLPPAHLLVHITDHGPGITHLSTILAGQFQSTTGLGLGILGAKRLIDKFTIQSNPQQGTSVVLGLKLPAKSAGLAIAGIGKIAEELVRYLPKSASDEVQQQNQELLQSLDLLSKARDDLEERVAERTTEITLVNTALQLEIEQHRKVANSLQEVTEQLNLALQSARVGTWSWAVLENKFFWDDYSCALFGVEPNTHPSTYEAFLSCIHPKDRAQARQEIKTAIQQNTTYEFSFRAYWPDNSLHYLMSRGKIYCNTLGEPSRMVGIYWDITEQKKAEHHLQLYREQLADATRVSSLGELASSVAHEINQPLATIAAYARGCLRRINTSYELTADLVDVIKEIALHAERAGEMVRRIQSFARKRQLFLEEILVDNLIEETLRLAKPELERFSMQAYYQPCPNLPIIKGDKIQLQQVILNLLRNGMEAMHEASVDNPKLIIEAIITDNSLLTIKVIDNGVGLPATIGREIFEPYFTTKQQGMGMGMGLAICRSIVEAHGGQLSASNLAESGCCFSFSVPF